MSQKQSSSPFRSLSVCLTTDMSFYMDLDPNNWFLQLVFIERLYLVYWIDHTIQNPKYNTVFWTTLYDDKKIGFNFILNTYIHTVNPFDKRSVTCVHV